MTSSAITSPWRIALGSRFDELAPELRDYFDAQPGKVGRGSGVFEVVGSPRRWLWPLLAVLGVGEMVHPAWEHDVPFRVVNRPGVRVVRAERVFHFSHGDRVMIDAIYIARGVIIDRLGRRERVWSRLGVDVVDGGLRFWSIETAIRVGSVRLRIPKAIAPTVDVTERFDQADGRHHVDFRLDLPIVGRVYEYRGAFDYALGDT